MASRPIREVQALNIVDEELSNDLGVEKFRYASIDSIEDLKSIEENEPWVLKQVRLFLTF